MNDVKSFCWSLLVISITVGICLMISRDGRSTTRHLRFVGAICITSVLISPMASLLSREGRAIEFPEAEYNIVSGTETDALIIAEAEKQIAYDAAKYAENEYGLTAAEYRAHLKTDKDGNASLEWIYIKTPVKSEFLISEVKKALSEKYSCDIYVISSKEKG